MIAIIDYGMGNLGSIRNMLARVGQDAVITSEPGPILRAGKLILPGVGSFDAAMESLAARGLVPLLESCVLDRKVPLLGICLGMQILSRGSEEGRLPGLGWIDADTVRFRPEGSGLRVPHMGWNEVQVRGPGGILAGYEGDPRFYFVHSYHVRCDHPEEVLATTRYGIEFHSALQKGNIVGTQFHPEKSHRFGMRLLKNFAEGGPC